MPECIAMFCWLTKIDLYSWKSVGSVINCLRPHKVVKLDLGLKSTVISKNSLLRLEIPTKSFFKLKLISFYVGGLVKGPIISRMLFCCLNTLSKKGIPLNKNYGKIPWYVHILYLSLHVCIYTPLAYNPRYLKLSLSESIDRLRNDSDKQAASSLLTAL